MRVSDLMLSNSFLSNLNAQKTRMQELQQQLATSQKISQPSDDPAGTASLLKYNNDLNSSDVFKNNIAGSLSFVNQTTTTLENLQSDTANIITTLTQATNSANESSLANYADKIDQTIKAMLDAANSRFDGKYIFGGTDQAGSPFGFTSGGNYVEVKSNDISGQQVVKISSTVSQKINMTGTEIFGTIVKGSGNLDSGSATGSTASGQTKIYDAAGNEYDFITSYTKTGANTYNLTYDIKDSGGNSVFTSPPAAKKLAFDSSGNLKSIDGSSSLSFNIKVPSDNINFNFDAAQLDEKNQAASVSLSANQKNDIFNTLISIRDSIKAGNMPTQEQINEVTTFNNHLLDKLTENGNVTNQLNDMSNLIDNQKLEVQKLVSNIQDVDVAQASINLQNQDYLLQLSYKLSSMILPKSILDYL